MEQIRRLGFVDNQKKVELLLTQCEVLMTQIDPDKWTNPETPVDRWG